MVRSEASLEDLDERRIRSELIITGHPLELGKCSAIHVEKNNGKSILFWGCMVLEILIDLEHPPERVSVIKAWDV